MFSFLIVEIAQMRVKVDIDSEIKSKVTLIASKLIWSWSPWTNFTVVDHAGF